MSYPEREKLLLAPYAMHAVDSAGRAVQEPEHLYRSPYQRDRDRITHSSAFRRLSHKTQVFTRDLGVGGDYHRSRLTHTLEVASIARTVARALRLNEDLVEALALAHDVGHPPFGHAGEDVLNELLRDFGGFNHNAQAVRLFTLIEHRYPDRPGLNLTKEVLDGQQRRSSKTAPNAPKSSTLLEEQVVDAADSIAYDAHDADDALEMGLLTAAELDAIPFWRDSTQRVRSRYAALSADDLRRATVHELIDRQVSDLLQVAGQTLSEGKIESVEQVRSTSCIARHSREIEELKRELEAFLFESVYRHPSVLAHRDEATAALRSAFEHFVESPDELPPEFSPAARGEPTERLVGDFLATLTDGAVLRRHPIPTK